MSERIRRLSRRNFLLTLGAGGTAAAATLVAKNAPLDGAAPQLKRDARGYQESAHVRNYYRTTKV
ncbi:MAG: hypothetical protein A2Z64_07420 [Betaproteobacteria bacterium RIFCSPLOWO2_02_67_12]|nr:MAG: hypothetical protein A2Z64_07420 [Betaproteobacteria bacterium RIFCSPLOWO2_02_67_12]OGA73079.1 MAG: hypothetical protein A3F77_14170 [Betaproteobacteria bacterium RIFCSPLOWO2_12_FULL_67_28]